MAIQRAINLKARQHPRAAQLTYAVLHAAMARAVKLGLIPRNPLDLCDKPAHKPARALILDPQQIHAYLVQAAASPSYALLLVMLLCGLRRSEALGLQWADLDLDRLVLHVRRQRLHGQPCPLKTDKSRRDLALAAPVAAELARVRSAQQVRSYHGWVCDVTPDRLRRDHMAVWPGPVCRLSPCTACATAWPPGPFLPVAPSRCYNVFWVTARCSLPPICTPIIWPTPPRSSPWALMLFR